MGVDPSSNRIADQAFTDCATGARWLHRTISPLSTQRTPAETQRKCERQQEG